jgi:hypothetical protein
LQNALKQCKNVGDPTKRKLVLQMNPQALKLKAEIKICKPEAQIRPVVNNIMHLHIIWLSTDIKN